jgi:16S rRNA (guanine527-N7)-methyltransferase
VISTDLIGRAFPELGRDKIAQLMHYATLLGKWNEKINLISRGDIGNVISRHIVPCLSLSKIGKFAANDAVLDIGTGGGLPGIPLAIVYEKTNFTLLDSTGKKIMAVENMLQDLCLKNAKAVNSRAENFSGQFGTIVARAVTNLCDFLKYSRKLLAPNGKILYMKGGTCEEDLKLLKRHRLYNIGALTGVEELSDKVILEIF